MSSNYEAVWRESIDNPETFWLNEAKRIDWVQDPQRAYTDDGGWFADGALNTCYNCVDRHVENGRGDALAVIYDSPVTGGLQQYTYAELLEEVGRTAAMLQHLGVQKGDRVIVYMPMIPHALFAMLACARLGAVHGVVFGGFAALELAKRIDDAGAKVVLTTSCGIEGRKTIAYKPIVDEALALARQNVDHVVVLQRSQVHAELNQACDKDWDTLRAVVAHDAIPACVPVASTDPLYILYTSGTTGTPKGVVRENGGHAVALAWSMDVLYGVHAGDVLWAASDVGWVVGHTYIVYAPLLAGATTIVFEGKPIGTPDPGTFWRTMSRHNVKMFLTAPTAIRAVRKEDPEGKFLQEIGTGTCRAVFLAGERADPDTIAWLEEKSGLPVLDNWWQTETGWPAIGTCFGLGDTRRRPGSAGFPIPGNQFVILGDDGKPVPTGESGFVAIKQPLAPGAYRTLWNNAEGYKKSFSSFPGYYETGDAGHFDEDGFLHIMGRTDDIINVAGHRLSTGQMEQIVAHQTGVAEAAVIGADDALKGMIPMAFVVASAGSENDSTLKARIISGVRNELGAVAALKNVYLVPALPKTRSGKILRNLLRKIGSGVSFDIPATIEDTSVPGRVVAAMEEQGK